MRPWMKWFLGCSLIAGVGLNAVSPHIKFPARDSGKEAKVTAPVSKPSAEPQKTTVTDEEVEDFRGLVTLLDPEQQIISQIQQYSDTELLYLTVTPSFIGENKVNQGDLAISMRDAWNKTCDCYGQLIFQSQGGQQLIHISALSKPNFKDK